MKNHKCIEMFSYDNLILQTDTKLRPLGRNFNNFKDRLRFETFGFKNIQQTPTLRYDIFTG